MDNNNNSNVYRSGCRELSQKLSTLGFALYETVLYLDAYPDSAEALEYYHHLREQYTQALNEYQSKCAPLTAFGNESRSSWMWIQSPWPWEYDAN